MRPRIGGRATMDSVVALARILPRLNRGITTDHPRTRVRVTSDRPREIHGCARWDRGGRTRSRTVPARTKSDQRCWPSRALTRTHQHTTASVPQGLLNNNVHSVVQNGAPLLKTICNPQPADNPLSRIFDFCAASRRFSVAAATSSPILSPASRFYASRIGGKWTRKWRVK